MTLSSVRTLLARPAALTTTERRPPLHPQTLEVTYRGHTIAQVPDLTVEAAAEFFVGTPAEPLT